MGSLFDTAKSLLGQGQPNPDEPTTEERIDYGLKADNPQGIAGMAQLEPGVMSQSEIEFKESFVQPSRFENSPYHKLLTKDVGLATINNDEDEDYFSLCQQCIDMAESMDLHEIRNRLHAQMIHELNLTRARKGRLSEIVTAQRYDIQKSVGEKKGEGWK